MEAAYRTVHINNIYACTKIGRIHSNTASKPIPSIIILEGNNFFGR